MKRSIAAAQFLLVLLALPVVCHAGAAERGIAGVAQETIRQERPRRWAVLIGVNRYVDQAGIGNLKYCVGDMKLLYQTLTSPKGGFDRRNVLLMTDGAREPIHRPTRDNLVTQIPLWLEQARPEDDVLIAFSGHGIFEAGKGYLLPSSARITNLRLTAIPLETVREWMDACKAKRKILILDCCHAGAGKAPDKMDSRFMSEIEKGEGFVRLASCRQNQKSNEDDQVGHGVFAYYLCEGLRGAADYDRDGRIDVDEAYRYAYDQVRVWAHRKGLRQNPVKSGKVEGLITMTYTPEVLLRRVPSQPGKPPAVGRLATLPDLKDLANADWTVILKDGSSGRLKGGSADKFLIELDSGATRIVTRSDIHRIERFVPPTKEPDAKERATAEAVRFREAALHGDAASFGAAVSANVLTEAEPSAAEGRPGRALLLPMAPVKKALERQFGEVYTAGDGLFVPKGLPGRAVAWVFPDGRIVAAAKDDLSSETQLSQVSAAWNAAARAVAGVTGALQEKDIGECFNETCHFFTRKPAQYQRLAVMPGDARGGFGFLSQFEWVLNWPDSRASWGRIVVVETGVFPSQLYLDGREILSSKGRDISRGDLSAVQFGEHIMKETTRFDFGARQMLLEAYFPVPKGRLALYDRGGRAFLAYKGSYEARSRETFSRKLSSLHLPVAEAAHEE